MSDTKVTSQANDPEPHRKDVRSAKGGGTQQPTQGGSTAAAGYWQSVAAAGRQARADAESRVKSEKPAYQRGLRP